MRCRKAVGSPELDARGTGLEKRGHLRGDLVRRPGEGEPVEDGVRYEPGGFVMLAGAGQRLYGG